MAITGAAVCAGGKPQLKFTYSGDYVVRKDGVVELLTSGTIMFLEPTVIDLFMVGGGGGGGNVPNDKRGGGGGGGGFTRTIRNVSVQNNQNITVTIGAGGAATVDGNSSAWNDFIVDGGKHGTSSSNSVLTYAGDGGSGGGGGVASNSDYGSGGSNGGDGEDGYPGSSAGYGANSGGKGQGYTTREFGENTGKLYSGGGGGGRYMASQTPIISMGGAGGGGSGGWYGAEKGLYQAPSAGGANTGGGGGGTAALTRAFYNTGAASGGSGIVCFREAQELPELAGTWVMNNRIYAPANTIQEQVQCTMVAPSNVGTYNVISIEVNNARFGVKTTITGSSYLTVYDFKNERWTNTANSSAAVLTFTAATTASDEFRAWLASNATKQ